MFTNTNKVKVLLYGNVISKVYRNQILIKFLLESEYHISLVCPDYYLGDTKIYSFKKFYIIFYLLELFIKAAFTDVIYLLPMNTKFIKSAILAAKLFNKKLVLDLQISLYDTFVRDGKLLKGKQIKDGSRKAREMVKIDTLALTKSDYIIHSAIYEINYWEKILGIKIEQSKVFVAPICNVYASRYNRKFMQDGILKICWWGTFIPLHGLDNILQAMKMLQEKQVQFTCNLFGIDNPYYQTYAEKIQLNNLSDRVFLRKDLSFSDNSLPNYLIDNCDLALGIFGNTDKARNAVPNKLIEALSMGIPTITMNSPALREFFDLETDLWTCEPSPESIAESILAIASGAAYPVNWEQTCQKVLTTFSVARYQEVVSQVLRRIKAEFLAGETSEFDISMTHNPISKQN